MSRISILLALMTAASTLRGQSLRDFRLQSFDYQRPDKIVVSGNAIFLLVEGRGIDYESGSLSVIKGGPGGAIIWKAQLYDSTESCEALDMLIKNDTIFALVSVHSKAVLKILSGTGAILQNLYFDDGNFTPRGLFPAGNDIGIAGYVQDDAHSTDAALRFANSGGFLTSSLDIPLRGNQIASAAAAYPGKGWVIAGSTDYKSRSLCSFVMLVDTRGNLLWERRDPLPLAESTLPKLQLASEGDVLVAASCTTYDDKKKSSGKVTRLDASGKVKWETFVQPDSAGEIEDLLMVDADHLLIAGNRERDDNHAFLAMLEPKDGRMLLENDEPGYGSLYSAALAGNGSVVFAGNVGDPGTISRDAVTDVFVCQLTPTELMTKCRITAEGSALALADELNLEIKPAVPIDHALEKDSDAEHPPSDLIDRAKEFVYCGKEDVEVVRGMKKSDVDTWSYFPQGKTIHRLLDLGLNLALLEQNDTTGIYELALLGPEGRPLAANWIPEHPIHLSASNPTTRLLALVDDHNQLNVVDAGLKKVFHATLEDSATSCILDSLGNVWVAVRYIDKSKSAIFRYAPGSSGNWEKTTWYEGPEWITVLNVFGPELVFAGRDEEDQACLVNVRENGQAEWKRTFSGSVDHAITDIGRLKDGYLVGGYYRDRESTYGFLRLVNKDGQLEDFIKMRVRGFGSVQKILVDSQKVYILANSYYEQDLLTLSRSPEIMVRSTDRLHLFSHYTPELHATWGTEGFRTSIYDSLYLMTKVHRLVPDGHGGFYVLVNQNDDTGAMATIAHYNGMLKKLQEVTISGLANVQVDRLTPARNGGLLLTGKSGLAGLLVSLDSLLQPRWQKNLGNSITSIGVLDSTILLGLAAEGDSYIDNLSTSGEIRWERPQDGEVLGLDVKKDTAFALLLAEGRQTDAESCPKVVGERLSYTGKADQSIAPATIACYEYRDCIDVHDSVGEGYITSAVMNFKIDSAYRNLFGAYKFAHAVVSRFDRKGSLVWQRGLDYKGSDTTSNQGAYCYDLCVLPDQTILASFALYENYVPRQTYLARLTPAGKFVNGVLISGLSNLCAIAPVKLDRLLAIGMDSGFNQYVLGIDISQMDTLNLFGIGAEERAVLYMMESEKLSNQVKYQSDIQKDEPGNPLGSAPLYDSAATRLTFENYQREMKEYRQSHEEKMATDEWTDVADLQEYAQRWVKIAKDEIGNKANFGLPMLIAMNDRAMGISLFQKDPPRAKELIANALEGAKAIAFKIGAGEDAIFLVDFYAAQKLVDLGYGNSFDGEKTQRKIISIFEANQPLSDDLQASYVANLTAQSILYIENNRPSDAEQVLKKVIRYSALQQDGDILSIQARLMLAGLELRKSTPVSKISPLLKPLEDRSPDDMGFGLRSEYLEFQMALAYKEQAYDKVIAIYFQMINDLRRYYGRQYTDLTLPIDLLYIKALRFSGNYRNAQKEAYELVSEHQGRFDNAALSLVYQELAKDYQQEHRHDSALAYIRKAAVKFDEVIAQSPSSNQESGQLRDLSFKPYFTDYLHILFDTVAAGNSGAELLTESLTVAQKANQNTTSKTIGIMIERFREKNDSLGNLLKEEDRLARKLVIVEARLRNLINKRLSVGANARSLYEEADTTERQLLNVRSRIRRDYPDFARLLNQGTISDSIIKSTLRPSEAILVYHLGDSVGFGWVITREMTKIFKIDRPASEIEKLVLAIRKTVDVSLFPQRGPGSIVPMHGNPTTARPASPAASGLPVFDTKDAYLLYTLLLQPADSFLRNKTSLIIIPDGPLNSIPFGLLLSRPSPPVRAPSDYKTLSWLALTYSISISPSLESFYDLRTADLKTSRPQLPFIGFGAPDFSGIPSNRRDGNLNILYRNDDRMVNLENLRKLPALPETADELKKIARSLGASEQYIHLGPDASETRVKTTDLTPFRVIAFATHGFAAGQNEGIAEPALALSPPRVATALDDGVLTASEIAQLNTRAEWVILSACNTASSDGTKGSESLSGLARAFFYSGSRSLLVSHWPVVSSSTELLIAATLEKMQRDKLLAKDEALKQSIREMICNKRFPIYAHPLFWAPFVVVGERLPAFQLSDHLR